MSRRLTELLTDGPSQAVRIPNEYRFEGDEVTAFQDLLTGDVVFSETPDGWKDYFSVLHEHELVREDAETDQQKARLFSSGGAQAVRIPAIFRFDCDQVYLFREDMTGDVILSRNAHGWDDFFKLAVRVHIPDDAVMFERERQPPPVREGLMELPEGSGN